MLVICNPISGNGKGRKILNRVSKILIKQKVKWELKETRYRGEAEEISKEAVKRKKHKCIFVIGGDGTVNEVIQSLVGTDISLAVIPGGTGNDFAYALGSNSSLVGIAQITASEVSKKRVDVGCIEMLKDDKKIYFTNVFGIGFDARVVKKFRELNFKPPKLNYFIAAMREILDFKGVDLKVNGIRRNFLDIVVGNGIREGGMFKISKQRNPLESGKLNLIKIRSASILKRAFYITMAVLGNVWNYKGVEYETITDIELETKDNLSTHIDGDLLLLPPGKIKVSVVPKALSIIQPAVK